MSEWDTWNINKKKNEGILTDKTDLKRIKESFA